MNPHINVRCFLGSVPRLLSRVLAIAATVALGACGGGSGNSAMSSTPPPSSTGAAMVTLTDAPGDFLSYMVNVVSLKLTRADGTVAETVPTATQVDFAQLVNLSEVLSAQQVPSGSYTAASVTLDYTGATIVVDNGSGGGITVPASNIINGSTNTPLVAPNNQITLTLQMPPGAPLVITQGMVANLALDFNLKASNTVAPPTINAATAASSVTVTVNAILAASLVPDATKQIRVRGALVSVTNTAANTSYTVNIRPFLNADGDQGQLVVNTTTSTSFTLNGTTYIGTAGLTALAALPTGTLTAATGSFNTTTKAFTATSVFAGTSLPGAGLDSVEGTVIARTGNVLTVSNGLIGERSQEGAQFSRQIAVTVAATTSVSEDGQAGKFGAQDISVGQHLQIFGTLATDSAGNRTLDASAGSARLMLTPVWGKVTSSAAGMVTLSLVSLDGLPPSVFTFAGTGSSAATDATASAYTTVIPSSLPLPAAMAGSLIKFYGFVTPFGMAPPDFAAVSLVDFASTNAELKVEWQAPGVTAPFAAPLSASNVLIAQATLQSAAEGELQIGPQRLNPATLTTGLKFDANTAAMTPMFAIEHRASHSVDSFTTFADLVTALTADLNGTTAVLEVAADGPYNSTTGVLSVNRMEVELNN